MASCPNCAAEIAVDATNCNACGTKVAWDKLAQNSPEKPQFALVAGANTQQTKAIAASPHSKALYVSVPVGLAYWLVYKYIPSMQTTADLTMLAISFPWCLLSVPAAFLGFLGGGGVSVAFALLFLFGGVHMNVYFAIRILRSF